MSGLRLLTPQEVAAMYPDGLDGPTYAGRKPYDTHCPGCGRFAKFVGGEHYYNGTWDCYRYTTRCSQCGDLDTECV